MTIDIPLPTLDLTPMAQCIYCQHKSGFISQVCKDCRKLIAVMKDLPDTAGYRTLLDTLLDTGVDPDKIDVFLDADPDGNGSVSQQLTARMTNQLLSGMGQIGHTTAKDVKKIQDMAASGQSFLDAPDVVAPHNHEEE